MSSGTARRERDREDTIRRLARRRRREGIDLEAAADARRNWLRRKALWQKKVEDRPAVTVAPNGAIRDNAWGGHDYRAEYLRVYGERI